MSKEDSVAFRSTFLCTYMSNHPDTLVAYVRCQGQVNEPVESARMVSIDEQSMQLNYKLKGSSVEKTVKVAFDPPLSGYEEVKPRLLALKLDAEESLGMVPRPQLTAYRFPRAALVQTLPWMIFLIYTTFNGPGIAWLRNLVGGDKTIWGVWLFVIVTHSLEALYTFSLCKRHGTGFVDGARYISGTLFFGFPIWSDMRKRIQKMRIESIGKIH